MQKMAKFRRNVFFKEWEHKVLRLSVRDMKDIQYNVEKCKVTKEVLFQLRQKHNNRFADTSVQALNKTIDGKMAYLQNALIDINMEIEAIKTKIEEQKEENTKIDKAIEKLNVEVSYQNFNRDHLLEERADRILKERINALLYRAKMIRRVQSNHFNIGELITLLEIQKLKTFPTLFTAKPPC
ncbi:CFAP43.2 family protein [Megaselia abdita]